MKKRIEQLWKNIAKFEEGEVKTSIGAKELQKDARAAERMKAYVKLFETEVNK